MILRKEGLGVWGVILFLALFLRLVGLDLNPVGMSHDDELHDLINAKSLAVAYENVPGVVAGILTPNGKCLAGDCVYAELETYAQIPWMLLFPLSMVWSKIPFVLASVGLVWVTGKFFENLSGSNTLGKIVGLILAINPWAIYYGRTAYAYNFTFLLFVLAAYFFTLNKSPKKNLVLGGLSAFGASLFYFGAKPIYPLVILWGVGFNLYNFKFRYLKFSLVFLVTAAVISLGYFLVLFNSLAGRRFLEIGVENIGLLERIGSFFGFFSPVAMFLTGQRVLDNYYMSGQGYFYALEFPFLILGIIAILFKRSKAWWLFLLIIIAVMPTVVKTSWASIYSLRAGLAYPLIAGVIGWGYYYGVGKMSSIKNKSRRELLSKSLLGLIIVLYIVSFGYFQFLYWHRLPVEQGTRWFIHERILTDYIRRVREYSDQNIIMLSGRPDGIFNSYVFFSGEYENKEAIKEINKSYFDEKFEFKGVRFINSCDRIEEADTKSSVIFVDQVNQMDCGLDQKNTSKIANPRDAGGMFNIINESLCLSYPKNRFPTPRNVFDFKVESLSNEEFCRIWITNPDNY